MCIVSWLTTSETESFLDTFGAFIGCEFLHSVPLIVASVGLICRVTVVVVLATVRSKS